MYDLGIYLKNDYELIILLLFKALIN